MDKLIKIEAIQINEISESTAIRIKEIYSQLSRNRIEEINEKKLFGLIKSESSFLFLAKIESFIVGIAILSIVELLAGRRGYINDVVVDGNFRRRGVGKKLVTGALEFSSQHRCVNVDLSSGSEKLAAQSFYQCMGFERRDTNFYRYVFPAE